MEPRSRSQTVAIAVVGLWHMHADILVRSLVDEGARLAAIVEPEDALYRRFRATNPDAPRRSLSAVLEDDSIQLIVLADAPSKRTEIAAQAMEHGKDVLTDKPCCLTLEDVARLREIQTRTGRHLVVWFGDRLNSRAAGLAEALVKAGAIGNLIHFVGLGPHQLNLLPRDEEFFDARRSGGILVDIGCHQIDLFLTLTGCPSASIQSARSSNVAHRDHPFFEDVGDMTFVSDRGTLGYARVDWYTPDGLNMWGDGRTFLVGTDGTIELRKAIDAGGRGPGAFVIFTDAQRTRVFDAAERELTFPADLCRDVVERTEIAMTSEHALAVCELSLRARELARANQ
jgi:predicted dehydrogenase